MAMFGRFLQRGTALFTNALINGLQNPKVLEAAVPMMNLNRNIRYLSRMIPKPVKVVSRKQLQSLSSHSKQSFLKNQFLATSKLNGSLSRWVPSRIQWSILANSTTPTRKSSWFTYNKKQPNLFKNDWYRAYTFINTPYFNRNNRYKFV